MPKVELHIYPPLSQQMSSKTVGALILEQEIEQGETLVNLLVRLANGNHEAWQGIFDAETHRIQPAIMAVLNGTVLARSEAPQTLLSDSDQIAFVFVTGGG